jgi:hypothetical protein
MKVGAAMNTSVMLVMIHTTLVAAPTVAEAKSGVWYSYSEWERAPDPEKSAYLAGAFDSLVVVTGDEQQSKMADHYTNCMHHTQMNLEQFTDDVAAFGNAHPEVQRHSVQYAMVNYLVSLCGAPPQ